MTTATAQIAQHLNVIESAITRCEEWAKVLFVVVKGLGARFVSKKVVKMERQQVSTRKFAEIFQGKVNFSGLKASVWTKKEGEIRVYFSEIGSAESLGYVVFFEAGKDGKGAWKWVLTRDYKGADKILEQVRKIFDSVKGEYKININMIYA